jgi:hypothetical protein
LIAASSEPEGKIKKKLFWNLKKNFSTIKRIQVTRSSIFSFLLPGKNDAFVEEKNGKKDFFSEFPKLERIQISILIKPGSFLEPGSQSNYFPNFF